MSTPAAADFRPRRTRLWSSWLWILAAILGAGVLWSAVRLIHDERLRRETLRALAQDKAKEIANLGAAKFDLLVAEALGPSWAEAGTRSDFLSELAKAQRERIDCDCRESLPVTRFFRFDASTSVPFDGSTRRLTFAAVGTADQMPDSTLTRVATAAWDEGRKHGRPHTAVDVIRHQAVITVTRPSDGDGAPRVYGAVVPVAGLAVALFAAFPRELPAMANRGPMIIGPVFMHDSAAAARHVVHLEQHRRLVRLDTLGLGIAAGTQNVFGSVAERPYMGTAVLPAPLDDFRVSVGLTGSQVSMSLLLPIAHDRLWWNGILVLATIVVCLFAIGSSRREVALARARSDFVAGVSHDLRMPLAQILLASETLALGRDRNGQDRAALTASILREARRLRTMVENVLLFSRSGAVGLDPSLQPVDVPGLFTEVIESVELAAADAGQSIEVKVADDTRVTADRGLLRQALVNIVDNAMKYGPRGQRVALRADRLESQVRIVVDDEGPGIPRTERERLFEPYERLSRDSTSERTGSGLGLAVAAQIIRSCHGSIAIEDGAVGARIVITLPAA